MLVACRSLVLLLGSVLVFGGCTSGSGEDLADTPYYKVLYDSKATADEVIGVARSADSVARSGDGSTLVTFTIFHFSQPSKLPSRDGLTDAQKGAWRLLGPSGDVVGSGLIAGFGRAFGFDEGFAVIDDDLTEGVTGHWMDTDATSHALGAVQSFEPTQAGDAPVTWDEGEPAAFLRPSDRSIHLLPGPVGDEKYFRKVALDGKTVWSIPGEVEGAPAVPLRRSIDGGRSWTTEQVPFPVDGASQVSLAAGAGSAALLFSDYDTDQITGIRVAPRAGDTRELQTDSLPMKSLSTTDLQFLRDGRILIGPAGSESTWSIAHTADNKSFSPIDTPEPFSSIGVIGDDLYGIGDDPKLYVSKDDGEKWEVLNVGH